MKVKFVISIFALFYLIGFLSVALAAPPLVIKPKSPKINSRLSEKLDLMAVDEKIKVWVFFTDKGIFDSQDYNIAVDNLAAKASRKAIDRRLNRAKKAELFDFYDIPVNADYIDNLRAEGFEIIHQSRWLNAVTIYVDKNSLAAIAALPFVAEIRAVAIARREPAKLGAFKPQVDIPDSVITWYGNSFTQLDIINVPILQQFGLTGEGVRIALLDAGFELDLPVFDRVNLVDQYDFVDDDPLAKEDTPEEASFENRHGTLVLSVIGGYVPDHLIGPAYDAEYLVARTEIVAEEVIIEEDNWVAAAEWANDLGAEIISTSLGYYDWYDYSDLDGNSAIITIAADLATSRGIAVFSSAGNTRNSGFYYITPPADGDSVIAVGSVTSQGVIASSSSAGPTYDGRIKPDIVAMGVGVYAVSNAGAYTYVSGTSFAAPLAAGAGALLLQAHPDWSPMDLRQAMIESGDRFNNPDNIYGYGLLDAFKASQLLYIDPVNPIVLSVGDSLDITFTVSGMPDSIPVFTVQNLPENAVFVDNGDRTATLRYETTTDDLGTRVFQIMAEAGLASYTLDVTLTVVSRSHIAVGPNPFTDSLTIFIGPNDGQPTEISIHAVNGEKVWDNFSDSYNMTTATVVWGGMNNDGAKVASGVYFVVVRTEELVRKFKVFKR